VQDIYLGLNNLIRHSDRGVQYTSYDLLNY
jgi:hypothetical protein